MTGTPPSAPNDPSGEPPAEEGGRQFSARPGRHQNPEPAAHSAPPEPPPGHGRHELPGRAGYPQFEGPGAAQYGSEPVEPPPPLPPQSGAPGTAPSYSQQTPLPPGAMPPGSVPPPGAAPQPGGLPPQPGYQGAGGLPPGAPPPQVSEPPLPYQPTESLDVGRALVYGWDRFRLNPIPWIGMGLLGLISWLTVTLLVNVFDVRSLPALLLLFAVASLLVWLLQAAMIRGALYETDGTPPDFPAFFGFVNAGSVLLTAVLVFVGALVASLACVFPAVIVGVLCMFALHFVIDQEQDPVTAIKSSAQLVFRNPVPTVLLALAVLIITAVGMLFCGLGLLVAGPVSAIAITYAYRTLTGGLVVQV
ncbi:DUF2189 domain-containing protein [Nocardia sp. IFM 10818]